MKKRQTRRQRILEVDFASNHTEKNIAEPNQRLRFPQNLTSIAIAIASGVMIGLAWRDEALGWMGVLGFGIFLAAHHSSKQRILTRGLEGWLTGTVAFAIACAWLPHTASYLAQTNGWVGLGISVLLWAFMGSQYACFAMIWGVTQGFSKCSWVAAPAIWVSLERIYPGLFPNSTACLLTGSDSLTQFAELGGVYLVAMLTIAMAGFASWTILLMIRLMQSQAIAGRGIAGWAVSGLVLLSINGWGAARFEQIKSNFAKTENVKSLRLGLVQADTQFNVSHARLIETSRTIKDVDLIIWPEASLGNYSTRLVDFRDSKTVFDNSRGDDSRYQPFPNPNAVLLAGGDTWTVESDDKNPATCYVSALLIDQQEQLIGQRYKVELMPFGEQIPLRSIVPFVQKWLGGERFISPGDSNEPIGSVNGVSIAAVLCCEDMHSELIRNLVNKHADVLVTIGNGMVFQSATALEQHFRIAKFRAIENRIPFVRCMSNGVSGLISPSGEMIYELPKCKDAAAIVTVNIAPRQQTFYSTHGNLLVNMLTVALLVAMCIGFQPGRHREAQLS